MLFLVLKYYVFFDGEDRGHGISFCASLVFQYTKKNDVYLVLKHFKFDSI